MATRRNAIEGVPSIAQALQAELDGLGADEQEEMQEPVVVLTELADALHQAAFRGLANVRIAVQPGFTVNMGQQFKFVVGIFEDQPNQFPAYSDVLFRAYVPVDGYPVVLDLFGNEKASCSNRDELQEALRRLLANRDFGLRIRSLRTLAEHQVTGG